MDMGFTIGPMAADMKECGRTESKMEKASTCYLTGLLK